MGITGNTWLMAQLSIADRNTAHRRTCYHHGTCSSCSRCPFEDVRKMRCVWGIRERLDRNRGRRRGACSAEAHGHFTQSIACR